MSRFQFATCQASSMLYQFGETPFTTVFSQTRMALGNKNPGFRTHGFHLQGRHKQTKMHRRTQKKPPCLSDVVLGKTDNPSRKANSLPVCCATTTSSLLFHHTRKIKNNERHTAMIISRRHLSSASNQYIWGQTTRFGASQRHGV